MAYTDFKEGGGMKFTKQADEYHPYVKYYITIGGTHNYY